MKPKLQILLSLAVLAAGMTLAGCTAELDGPAGGGNKGETEGGLPVTLSFRVNVPGQTNAGTRALTDADEKRLDWIDALVFDQAGGFLYRAKTYAPTDPIGGQTHFKEFEVDLLSSAAPRIIHFMANSRDAVDTAVMAEGDLEEMVLSQITATVDDVLTAGKQARFPFPMWGSKTVDAIPVDGIKNDADRQFTLLRSVVRMDVGTGGTYSGSQVSWNGLMNFELTSVRIYRAADGGRVVPDLLNVSPGGEQVTAISLPAGLSGVDYGVIPPATAGDPAVERSIYLYEREAGSASDCLLLAIGRKYEGGSETFYKIELRDPDGGLIPLLRNHNYRVNIIEVLGKGHETVAIALQNNPIGTRTEITVENAGLMNSVYDEQHHLSSDKMALEYHREQKSYNLLVETNHPDGIEITALPGWITLDDGAYTIGDILPTGSTTLKVTAAENNADTDRIPAHIGLATGRLELEVEVSQGYLPELDLSIDPSSLMFYRMGNPQIGSNTFFTVTAGSADPTVQELTFAVRAGGNWTDPATEFVLFPADNLAGNVSGDYDIQPDADAGMTVNKEAILEVTLTVPYGSGKTHSITRELKVVQLAQDAIFIPNALNPYPQYYGTYDFSVISELPWVARIKDNDPATYDPEGFLLDVISPNPPGEIDNGQVELSENNSFAPREATLDFLSWDGDPSFSSKDLAVIQSGYPVELIFTNPASGLLNITGAEPGDQTISFNVNSAWNYETSGAYWPQIGTLQGLTENTDYTPAGVQPNTPQSVAMVLEPVDYKAQAGTPAAGTVYSGLVNFTTADHAPALSESRTLTINRTVPAHFDYTSASPAAGTVLAQTGATVTVNASTNAAWNIVGTSPTNNSGTAATTTVGKASMSANAYASHSLAFTVANYNVVNTSAPATAPRRNITVTYTGGGKTGTVAYTQKGYAFTPSTSHTNGAVIAGEGGRYTATVTPASSGDTYPAIYFRAYSGTTLGSVTIPAGAATQSNTNLTVPPYESQNLEKRTIYFQWSNNNSNWYTITQGEQESWPFTWINGYWVYNKIYSARRQELNPTYGVLVPGCPSGTHMANSTELNAIVGGMGVNYGKWVASDTNWSYWSLFHWELINGRWKWGGSYIRSDDTVYWRCIKD